MKYTCYGAIEVVAIIIIIIINTNTAVNWIKYSIA